MSPQERYRLKEDARALKEELGRPLWPVALAYLGFQRKLVALETDGIVEPEIAAHILNRYFETHPNANAVIRLMQKKRIVKTLDSYSANLKKTDEGRRKTIRPERNKARLLAFLMECQAKDPDTPVGLNEISAYVGFSKTQAMRVYDELLQTHADFIPPRPPKYRRSKVIILSQQLKQLTDEGLTRREIKQRLRVTDAQIYLAKQRLEEEGIGIQFKNPGKEMLKDIRNRMADLRARGLTYRKIAEKLNVDEKFVGDNISLMIKQGRVKRLGPKRKRRSREEVEKFDQRVKKIIETQDLKATAIAKKLRQPIHQIQVSIYRLIRSNQIEPRRKPKKRKR